MVQVEINIHLSASFPVSHSMAIGDQHWTKIQKQVLAHLVIAHLLFPYTAIYVSLHHSPLWDHWISTGYKSGPTQCTQSKNDVYVASEFKQWLRSSWPSLSNRIQVNYSIMYLGLYWYEYPQSWSLDIAIQYSATLNHLWLNRCDLRPAKVLYISQIEYIWLFSGIVLYSTFY